MYTIKLPQEIMKNLWQLREYHGRGSIIGQVREAVRTYLEQQQKLLGSPISKVDPVIEQKRPESREKEQEQLVKIMDEVVEEQGEEPISDRTWQNVYEIACERFIKDRIKQ